MHMEARARSTKGEHPGISPDRGTKASLFLNRKRVIEMGTKSRAKMQPKSMPKGITNQC